MSETTYSGGYFSILAARADPDSLADRLSEARVGLRHWPDLAGVRIYLKSALDVPAAERAVRAGLAHGTGRRWEVTSWSTDEGTWQAVVQATNVGTAWTRWAR